MRGRIRVRTAGFLIVGLALVWVVLGEIGSFGDEMGSEFLLLMAGLLMIEGWALFLLFRFAKPASLKARPWFWGPLLLIILIVSVYLPFSEELTVIDWLFRIVQFVFFWPVWLVFSLTSIFF